MKVKFLLPVLLLALSCNGAGEGEDISFDPAPSEDPSGEPAAPRAMIVSASVSGLTVGYSGKVGGVPPDDVVIDLVFTREVDPSAFVAPFVSFTGGRLQASPADDPAVVRLTPESELSPSTTYTLTVMSGENFGVDIVEPYRLSFTTAYDTSDKFPRIGDDDLLTLVQEKTFGYFWDYAHPVSGLARERLGSGETVTTGGSGFGIMAIPVGIERGFITREQGAERVRTILSFLGEKADRFHGAYPHWMNGTSGKVIPFSSNDNGADLVETAFLMQGLLTVAQYFDGPLEEDIPSAVDAIWRGVEWNWFTKGENVLYWHWSPDKAWAMNMPIRGWNEGLIVYVLAAASPTFAISPEVYHNGWASNGGIRNGKSFYGVTLPLGPDRGGPMFFAHYSFLGLDPRGLSDAYASYWDQNVAHATINRAYCAANPGNHSGYSASCWGLTASDCPGGYAASSPTSDNGTIAPTAALSSFPYTPEASMEALHSFYYIYGDKLWGEYGFKDAFNLDSGWFASSYLAIDQGPIVVMIENYRSGLGWKLFMSNDDVKGGLDALGFEYKGL